MNVRTNIGAKFLKLVDKHFPPGNRLHPLLNRNSVKMSYCCLPNMGSIRAKHNAGVLRKADNTPPANPPRCNCQKPALCPLPGMCTVDNAIYQTTVTTQSSNETYVWLTSKTFKKRHYSHEF